MKDGGYAFACAVENGHQEGMTLRDYLAGQALIGTLSTPNRITADIDIIVKNAYAVADAMIAERERNLNA